MVTGMRPIIEAVSKSIYSPLKAKISMLKFHSFSNKEFAIQFNKPETTLHESPATTEAVRIASKWQVVISLQPYKKKALFHISKTELFSYRLSVQACQLRIGWLSPVKVNQASCPNNLSLVVGHVAGRKLELGGCAVGADCVGFYARKFFRNHLFCSLSSVVLMSTTSL